jgi:hypothetical protein
MRRRADAQRHAQAACDELWNATRAITIGERSGPPVTKKAWRTRPDLARDLRASIVNFEELADADWAPVGPGMSHWANASSSPS